MDIKAPLESNSQFPKYDRATGVKVDLEKIKKSIEIIKNSGIDYEFRTTAIPTIHSREDIVEIAKEILPAKRYFLQNFRPEKTLDIKYEKYKPFKENELELIQKECNRYVPTKIRN
jgi:pyruvate formate lyase activating enzyme